MKINWQENPGQKYLKQFPDLGRWINTCVVCARTGYKPELPDQIRPWPTEASHNLRKYFEPLPIDEFGRCEECQAVSGSDAKEAEE